MSPESGSKVTNIAFLNIIFFYPDDFTRKSRPDKRKNQGCMFALQRELFMHIMKQTY